MPLASPNRRIIVRPGGRVWPLEIEVVLIVGSSRSKGTSELHEQVVHTPKFPVSTASYLSFNLYDLKERKKGARFVEGFCAKNFSMP